MSAASGAPAALDEHKLADTPNPQERHAFLQMAVDQVRRTLLVDLAVAYLVDPERPDRAHLASGKGDLGRVVVPATISLEDAPWNKLTHDRSAFNLAPEDAALVVVRAMDYAPGAVSLAYIPIWLDQQLLGFVLTFVDMAQALTPAELRAATFLGRALASPLRAADVVDRARSGAAHLDLLYRVGQELNKGLSLPALLDRLSEFILRYSGADRVGMLILDEQGRPVFRRLFHDFDSEEEAETALERALHGGLAGRVLETKRGLIREPNGRDSLVIVPLLLSGRVVGLLSGYKRIPLYFTSEHLELFSAIASEAAVAVENARLFGEMERRVQERTTELYEQMRRLEQATAALEHRVAFEQLISAISADLLARPARELDQGIREALRRIGEFSRVDRTYLFTLDEGRLRNAHEWLAEGVESNLAKLRDLPVEDYGWWMDTLGELQAVHIPCVADLPPDVAPVRETLLRQGVQSMVCVPLVYSDRLVGALGLDAFRQPKAWSQEDIALLRTAGDILASALQRGRIEERLRFQALLLDSVRESVIAIDLEGRVAYWGKGAEVLYGYTEQEMLGQPLVTMIPADKRAVEAERIRLVQATGLWVGEDQHQRKDGSVFWADIYLSLTSDADGRPLGVIGISRDISAKRAVEEALRESERRNAVIVSAIPDMLCRLDREGNYLEFRAAHGWEPVLPASEFVGKNIRETLPEVGEMLVEAIAKALDSGQVVIREYSLTRGGQVRVEEARLIPSGPEEVLAVVRDITARKRVEQERGQHAADLAMLNRIGAALSSSLDLDTVLDRALSSALDAAGSSMGSLHLVDEENNRVRRAVSRGIPPTLEAEICLVAVNEGPSGRALLPREPHAVWLANYRTEPWASALLREGITSIFSVPLIARGEVIGILTLASREPRELGPRETDLLAAIGAQISPNVQNALLYSDLQAAHERVQALSAKLDKTLEEERARLSRELHDQLGQSLSALKLDLQIAHGSAGPEQGRLKEILGRDIGLVDQSLQHVRNLAAGLRSPALEELGLTGALRELAQGFEPLTGISTHFWTSGAPIALAPEVALALYRIAQESLTNVMKHANASQVNLQLLFGEGHVRLVVQDNGVGFDAELVRRSAVRQGHLGLVGIAERAQLLGGSFDIESEPGLGTRIVVEVPII